MNEQRVEPSRGWSSLFFFFFHCRPIDDFCNQVLVEIHRHELSQTDFRFARIDAFVLDTLGLLIDVRVQDEPLGCCFGGDLRFGFILGRNDE